MNATGTLQVTTPSDREVVLTRVFNAPRALVYATHTRPELIRRWLIGPPGWTMTECTVDLRVGGAYRYAWTGPDGAAMAMSGFFRELVPFERIVNTETFEFGCTAQASEQIGTCVFTEQDGKTILVTTVLYPTKEARDATLASGMEHGVAAGYDLLDGLLASGDVR